MKFYITNFSNLKKLKENQIPINTTVWPPKFWKFGLNNNNVFFGINEPLLSPYKLETEAICQNACPYKKQVPECPFLIKYEEYLQTIDFEALLEEFARVAKEVKLISNYNGEPEIVLLVYEKVNNPCSERHSLKKLFKQHSLELTDIV